MTDFDPDRFEDKYEHYFPELQRAYQQAFDAMSEDHDSELIHAIDQGILAESEPFYEGDGQFRIDLPEGAVDQITDVVVVDEGTAETVLDRYTDELQRQLRSVFGLEGQ